MRTEKPNEESCPPKLFDVHTYTLLTIENRNSNSSDCTITEQYCSNML